MNHYVCCPLIVLSGALHTGTNQLPWTKRDLQAEFWEAHEGFRKGGSNLSVWFAPHSKCASRCRLDGQEVIQHTFWTDLPRPFLELLVLARCFQGSGRSKHGLCQSLNLLLFRLEFEWITSSFSVWRQSRPVAVAHGSSFVLSMGLVVAIHACSPHCQRYRPGQDCWEVGDVSCAGYLWILACLTGCPLCWNKRIIVAS